MSEVRGASCIACQSSVTTIDLAEWGAWWARHREHMNVNRWWAPQLPLFDVTA